MTWYWQSSASGTSTANSSTSVTLTSGTTYYLRARDNVSLCWGTARTVNYAIQAVPTWYKDNDGDGFAETTIAQCADPGVGYTSTAIPVTDCDDTDAQINPNTVWYADNDGDGLGDPQDSTTQCTQPAAYVKNAEDQCPQEAGNVQGCASIPYVATQFSNTENYVFTRVYQKEMTSSTEITENSDVIESITYF